MIARLRTSLAPFATVLAPAGYGKTTLLAQWDEVDPRQFAWVALDRRDDDPVVFLRYVAAALHRVEPLPPVVFDVLSGPGRSTWARCVPVLGNAMAALGRSFVLVLDDLPDGGLAGGPVPRRALDAGRIAEVEVDAERPVAAGIDGEALVLDAPLRFRIRPGVLSVRIARRHPGASPSAMTPEGPRAGIEKEVDADADELRRELDSSARENVS